MNAWRKTIIRELKLSIFCLTILVLTRFTDVPFEPHYIGVVIGFWVTSAGVMITATMHQLEAHHDSN